MITINKQKLYKSFISIGRSTRKKRLIYEKFRTRQQFSLFRIVNSTDDEKRKQTFAHACVSSGDPLRIFLYPKAIREFGLLSVSDFVWLRID